MCLCETTLRRGTEGTGLQGFSYAAAVVRCGGTDGITYRVKYERDLLGFEEEPNELPACELSGFATGPWATARKVSPDAEGTNPGVWTKSPGGNPLNTGDQLLEHSFSIKVSQSGLLLHFDLTSSDGCTFINSGLEGGVAKEGQNLCSTAVTLSNNDMRLTFDLGEYEVLGSPLVTG